MKKYKEEIQHGSFVHFSNQSYKYTMVAVSRVLPTKNSNGYEVINTTSSVVYTPDHGDLQGEAEFLQCYPVVKQLTVGIAICRADDTYNEERGIDIARGRALRSPAVIISVNMPGIINTDFVKTVLLNVSLQFEENPGLFLKGYDQAKANYIRHKELQDKKNSLTEEEKTYIEVKRNNKDLKLLDKLATR